MNDTVVTTLQIDSDTCGADEYSRKMDEASKSSRSIYESQRESTLAIAGTGAAVIGFIAAGSQLLDFVAKANKDLADMAKNARLVGLSLADFQSLKFAGNVEGLSDQNFNAGIQKSAALLADAARNNNDLAKTFALNGIAIKDTNGRLISQNELIEKSGKLILGLPNMQDRIKLAETLGFGREFVPLLEQAGRNFGAIGDEARKAGVIISDETVGKAIEFDKEWRKSSVAFAANLKAALLEWLPMVNNLINQALELAKALPGVVDKHANDNLRKGADAVGLPKEGELEFFNFSSKVAQEGARQYRDAETLAEAALGAWRAVSNLIVSYKEMPTVTDIQPDWMKAVSGYDTGAVAGMSDLATASIERQNTATTKLLQTQKEAKDAVERAIDSTQKHILRQQADTVATGNDPNARRELREKVEAQRLALNDNESVAVAA